MKCTCEMCGASTTDEKEIAKCFMNGICPVCLSIGSLALVEEGVEE